MEIKRNGKTYIVETERADRWFQMVRVYEIAENGSILFVGKCQALDIDDAINELLGSNK